jgi:hypothetical protein
MALGLQGEPTDLLRERPGPCRPRSLASVAWIGSQPLPQKLVATAA